MGEQKGWLYFYNDFSKDSWAPEKPIVNGKYHIVLAQTYAGNGNYWYRIYVNGAKAISEKVKSSKVKNFDEIKVWVSDKKQSNTPERVGDLSNLIISDFTPQSGIL